MVSILTLSEMGEDCLHVKVESCCKCFPRSIDFRDEWVFPHGIILP